MANSIQDTTKRPMVIVSMKMNAKAKRKLSVLFTQIFFDFFLTPKKCSQLWCIRLNSHPGGIGIDFFRFSEPFLA